MSRLLLTICCGGVLLALACQPSMAAEATTGANGDEERTTSADRYLELGTEKGELGGADQKTFERGQIKDQIKSFIPPLLRPAFVGHAYVLPPNSYSVSVAHRITEIKGSDFFMNGRPNRAGFADAKVQRHLTDLDLFYGFDLNRKYLHGFTAALNIPYLDSNMDGSVHPNGQQFIAIENAGSTQAVGDISLFLKKKIWDQGDHPFGFAVAGAVTFPTGNNDEQFGSDGRVTTRRPPPPNTIIAQGFDAFMAANVASGMWGAPQCFFRNFNLANRALCGGGAFGVPAAGPLSFAPGGINENNQFIGDFPFNNGVFGGFSGDGRLPSTLQPGTGSMGYFLGAFLTRQFNPGDWPGRSALHLGVTHNFVSSNDGIDFGDTTTYFASFVKPLLKDYLALDLAFVGFDHANDSYVGKIPVPEIHACEAIDVGVVGGCGMTGDQAFVFELGDRPSFSGGFTGMVAPSLIFSPDPQIRLTLSALVRVIEPDLGPAPPWVIRVGIDVTF